MKYPRVRRSDFSLAAWIRFLWVAKRIVVPFWGNHTVHLTKTEPDQDWTCFSIRRFCQLRKGFIFYFLLPIKQQLTSSSGEVTAAKWGLSIGEVGRPWRDSNPRSSRPRGTIIFVWPPVLLWTTTPDWLVTQSRSLSPPIAVAFWSTPWKTAVLNLFTRFTVYHPLNYMYRSYFLSSHRGSWRQLFRRLSHISTIGCSRAVESQTKIEIRSWTLDSSVAESWAVWLWQQLKYGNVITHSPLVVWESPGLSSVRETRRGQAT